MSEELESRKEAAIQAVNRIFGLTSCNERDQIEALQEIQKNIDDCISALKEQINKE